MNRLCCLLIIGFFMGAGVSCVENRVRMYVAVDDSCEQYCGGLTFDVNYDDVVERTLTAGETVLIERAIGDNGKLYVTVFNENDVENHPLKCQTYINSKINIQGWTPLPEDEVYVYYNQLIYFQNSDIHVDITCAPLPDITAGACDDVSCWSPPENTCLETTVIDLVQPRGVCAEGECVYPSKLDLCPRGWCYNAKCGSALACEEVYCLSPPPSVCTAAGDLTVYTQRGFCHDGECVYESRLQPCPSKSCVSGVCVEDPCANVFCDKPPANHCIDQQTLKSFSAAGRCVVSGGRPTCVYEEKDSPCDYGCTEGNCIVYACTEVICNTPPANYCDMDDLIAFSDKGYCNNGGCRYPSQRVFCEGSCREGKCRDEDPCIGMICNDPPAPYCADAATLRTFAAEGTCADGFCNFAAKDVSCGGACTDGVCSSDPCLGANCNTPPSDYCIDEVTAMQFAAVGNCVNRGECDYGGVQTACPDGCFEGWCP